MTRSLLIICLILSLTISITEPPTVSANTIIVDGSCTLIDAIIAANTDTATGGCNAGSGPDTIVLNAGVGLPTAYPGSTNIGGGQAGLPDITSDITIEIPGFFDGISGNNSNFRIFNVMSGGSLTLNGGDLRFGKIINTPNAMGGAIYVDVGGTLSLNNVYLGDNRAFGLDDPSSPGNAYGGAIYNNGTITNITASTIQKNFAEGGDATSGNGGDASGGAIYNAGTITLLEQSDISVDFAIGGASPVSSGDAFGGGIYNAAQIVTIDQSMINRNDARSQPDAWQLMGGGIYNAGSINTVTNTEVSFNEIQGADCAPEASCSDGWFYGGGIYSDGNIGTMSGVSVSNNLISAAKNQDNQFLFGGGMMNVGHITLLENCNFFNNTLHHEFTIDDMSSNLSLMGGGLANFPNSEIEMIRRCTFSDNLLELTGQDGFGYEIGGGLVVGGTVEMEEITIGGNTLISTNDFAWGSGLSLISADVTLSNSSIHNNIGGIGTVSIEETSNVDISNTTISDNMSAGIISWAAGGTTTLNHVTVINNTLLQSPMDLQVDMLATASFVANGSLIGTVEDCTDLTGSNNLTTDPAVVSQCPTVFDGTFTIGTDIDSTLQNNGGSTLTHALINHGGNPAIDGNPGCGLATDQRGVARDANCDIGAYEVSGSGPPTDTPVPPTDTSVPPTDTPVPPTDTPIPPTDTPIPPTDTLVPPTDTPTGPVTLVASAVCVNEDLAVTISAGDGPFNITASAGINTPVLGVSIGTTTIQGPEKWDDLTVTEISGDTQSMNLGQFKCRSDERPVPLVPAHLEHITDTTPTFAWAGITDANNYRVFVFDDKVAANRTVDVRQNSGGPTFLTLNTPLPTMRLFWRVRGRQNRIWSLWSIRFTFFIDPVPSLVSTPVPTSAPDGQIIVTPQPTLAHSPTPLPSPPNSR